jgi:uncharacterized protein (TIGR02594 family)
MNRAPAWLIEARRHIGQREVPGPGSNAWIKSLWLRLPGGAWFWKHFGSDDSKLPWCGAFVASVMDTCGHQYPKKYASAKAWLDWGTWLEHPEVGCVVVFARDGGGHVGFVVGRDLHKNLLVLGANQGDAVSIAAFRQDRVMGYRWPSDAMAPVAAALPLGAADLSRSEA